MKKLLAGIEAGGTKFVCAAGFSPVDIVKSEAFPTETPDATFARCRAFLASAASEFGAVEALGVAAFGPIGVDPAASDYGVVGRTPKPSWSGADYRHALRTFSDLIEIDSDVNAAALAEQRYGTGKGFHTIAYVTVGTGIGAGVVKDGRTLIGARHSELGHIRPPQDRVRDPFTGTCPFHGACLEGLASGPAVLSRWGGDLSSLPPEHYAHDLEAEYLAHLMLTITLAFAPQRIICGGGVARATGLIARVNEKTRALIGGYVDPPGQDASDYVIAPGLGGRSGVVGALALAERRLAGR